MGTALQREKNMDELGSLPNLSGRAPVTSPETQFPRL